MNAYKLSENSLVSGKIMIDLKIKRRTFLLKKYKIHREHTSNKNLRSIQDLLLFEARHAKYFWKEFRTLLPSWCNFIKRHSRSHDIVNKLLDIGYHHLTNKVIDIFNKYSLTCALGILHEAHSSDSSPLAYDLVEMFRADIVDSEVLRFLRLKKKPVLELEQKDVARFVNNLNRRLEHKYFLKDFNQCHTYLYYMELQVFKFIKAVNHKEVFFPISLPSRHDTRCSKNVD